MHKPKIYLETTIFNYYFDTERDAHPATVKLFEQIKAGKYEAYTSLYVTSELEEAQEPKRSKMLDLIPQYKIITLDVSSVAEHLAKIYVTENIVPAKFSYDGLHIAVATINNLDFICSLNFKHINKFKTKENTNIVNKREGYSKINIVSPMEVVY